MDQHLLSAIGSTIFQNPGDLVGFILPPFIDLLNKDIPKEREAERFIVTFGACLAVAALFNASAIMANSWAQVFTSFGIIFTQSQGVYNLYFKNSFLRDKILETLYKDVSNGVDTTPAVTPSVAPVVETTIPVITPDAVG